jgi:hypothetical protein
MRASLATANTSCAVGWLIISRECCILEVDLTTAVRGSLTRGRGASLGTFRGRKIDHRLNSGGNSGSCGHHSLDGRNVPQTLFTVSDDIQNIDAGADGSVFTDLISRPAEVVRPSSRGGPMEKIAVSPAVYMDMVVALPDGRQASRAGLWPHSSDGHQHG